MYHTISRHLDKTMYFFQNPLFKQCNDKDHSYTTSIRNFKQKYIQMLSKEQKEECNQIFNTEENLQSLQYLHNRKT